VKHLALKSGVTLKRGLGFIQGHWKWHHLIDRMRVPIRLPYYMWRYLLSFARYSDLLVENCEIFIPHLYCIPRRNFVSVFDADKTRMIGLPYGEKQWQYVKLFSSDTGPLRTDGQTDGRSTDGQTELLYQYRASVCRRAIKITKFS